MNRKTERKRSSRIFSEPIALKQHFFATENENAGGREVTCVFVRMGTLNEMNQEIFLSFRRSLSEIIAINSEFVGFPREFWIV